MNAKQNAQNDFINEINFRASSRLAEIERAEIHLELAVNPQLNAKVLGPLGVGALAGAMRDRPRRPGRSGGRRRRGPLPTIGGRTRGRADNTRFDPDAIDGDDDNLVQDNTRWERIAKPWQRVAGRARAKLRQRRLRRESQARREQEPGFYLEERGPGFSRRVRPTSEPRVRARAEEARQTVAEQATRIKPEKPRKIESDSEVDSLNGPEGLNLISRLASARGQIVDGEYIDREIADFATREVERRGEIYSRMIKKNKDMTPAEFDESLGEYGKELNSLIERIEQWQKSHTDEGRNFQDFIRRDSGEVRDAPEGASADSGREALRDQQRVLDDANQRYDELISEAQDFINSDLFDQITMLSESRDEYFGDRKLQGDQGPPESMMDWYTTEVGPILRRDVAEAREKIRSMLRRAETLSDDSAASQQFRRGVADALMGAEEQVETLVRAIDDLDEAKDLIRQKVKDIIGSDDPSHVKYRSLVDLYADTPIAVRRALLDEIDKFAETFEPRSAHRDYLKDVFREASATLQSEFFDFIKNDRNFSPEDLDRWIEENIPSVTEMVDQLGLPDTDRRTNRYENEVLPEVRNFRDSQVQNFRDIYQSTVADVAPSENELENFLTEVALDNEDLTDEEIENAIREILDAPPAEIETPKNIGDYVDMSDRERSEMIDRLLKDIEADQLDELVEQQQGKYSGATDLDDNFTELSLRAGENAEAGQSILLDAMLDSYEGNLQEGYDKVTDAIMNIADDISDLADYMRNPNADKDRVAQAMIQIESLTVLQDDLNSERKRLNAKIQQMYLDDIVQLGIIQEDMDNFDIWQLEELAGNVEDLEGLIRRAMDDEGIFSEQFVSDFASRLRQRMERWQTDRERLDQLRSESLELSEEERRAEIARIAEIYVAEEADRLYSVAKKEHLENLADQGAQELDVYEEFYEPYEKARESLRLFVNDKFSDEKDDPQFEAMVNAQVKNMLERSRRDEMDAMDSHALLVETDDKFKELRSIEDRFTNAMIDDLDGSESLQEYESAVDEIQELLDRQRETLGYKDLPSVRSTVEVMQSRLDAGRKKIHEYRDLNRSNTRTPLVEVLSEDELATLDEKIERLVSDNRQRRSLRQAELLVDLYGDDDPWDDPKYDRKNFKALSEEERFELAKQIFGWDDFDIGDGISLSTELDEPYGFERGAFDISGVIKATNEDGETIELGNFRMMLDPDNGEIYAASLYIEDVESELDTFGKTIEDVRNSGFGSAFATRAMIWAKGMGYETIEVDAEDDGVFVWPYLGFRDLKDLGGDRGYDKSLRKSLRRELVEFDAGRSTVITSPEQAHLVERLIQRLDSPNLEDKPSELEVMMVLGAGTEKNKLYNWWIKNSEWESGVFSLTDFNDPRRAQSDLFRLGEPADPDIDDRRIVDQVRARIDDDLVERMVLTAQNRRRDDFRAWRREVHGDSTPWNDELVTEELVRGAFEISYNGVISQVMEVQERGGIVYVSGIVSDANHGEIIGSFARSLNPNSRVTLNEHINIDSRYRNRGFASAFNTNAELWLGNNGYDQFALATVGDGSFVWPLHGFTNADIRAYRTLFADAFDSDLINDENFELISELQARAAERATIDDDGPLEVELIMAMSIGNDWYAVRQWWIQNNENNVMTRRMNPKASDPDLEIPREKPATQAVVINSDGLTLSTNGSIMSHRNQLYNLRRQSAGSLQISSLLDELDSTYADYEKAIEDLGVDPSEFVVRGYSDLRQELLDAIAEAEEFEDSMQVVMLSDEEKEALERQANLIVEEAKARRKNRLEQMVDQVYGERRPWLGADIGDELEDYFEYNFGSALDELEGDEYDDFIDAYQQAETKIEEFITNALEIEFETESGVAFKTEVEEILHPGNHGYWTEVRGVIYAKDEYGDYRIVGNFTRKFDFGNREVENALLAIGEHSSTPGRAPLDFAESVKGAGFGSTFNAHSYLWYANSGVLDGVDVHAGWEGHYVWGKLGFQASEKDLEGLQKALRKEIKKGTEYSEILNTPEQMAMMSTLLNFDPYDDDTTPSEMFSYQTVILTLLALGVDEPTLKRWIINYAPFNHGKLELSDFPTL